MIMDDLPALAAILQDEETMYAYAGAFSDCAAKEWLSNQLLCYHEDGISLANSSVNVD